MASTPCNDCPWRKDAPPGHWHPDHFRDIYRTCQDDGVGLMLCHKAAALPPGPKRDGLFCRGWVLVMGGAAIGVRLALLRGIVSTGDLDPAPNGPDLYETFDAMMRANGVVPPPRNNHFGRAGRG